MLCNTNGAVSWPKHYAMPGSVESMIYKNFSPPYIVIGMHRSGTSMLAGLLHSSGIFMGNDWDEHQESVFFQSINQELLKRNAANWAAPQVPSESNTVLLPTAGLLRHYLKAHVHPSQLIKLLRGNAWGWKDPRNTFTLNCWLKLFPDAKVIHIHRNGLDVALSLSIRSKKKTANEYAETLKDTTAGFVLWEKYVAQAFSFESALGDRMITVQFEKLIASEESEIRKLEAFVGRPLRSQIGATADRTRTQRYREDEHAGLISEARQNYWMNRLGYC
jgi:hypothetical protein